MVTEDYCNFEIAKLLKEKGFEGRMHTFYTEEGTEMESAYVVPSNFFPIYRPTLQMAMKWLREKYNKIIVPGISLGDRTSSTISHYIVGIWYIPENNGGAFCYTSPTPYGGYPSFEEACESAIKYCLEKLI